MRFKPISFKGFKGRGKLLSEEERYSMYPIMFFRTNVDLHTRRAQWIAEELLPYLKNMNLDPDKLRLLCRIHDDPEIITGDIQLGRKIFTMTQPELDLMERNEERARKVLASLWPDKLHGYNYYDLLQEAYKKKTPEAQVMKLIDKIDGFGESLHEVYSGNDCFLKHPELPTGINPVQNYIASFREFPKKYSLLANLFDNRHPFLSQPKDIDQEELVRTRSLPTPNSIRKPTGNPHYDAWRNLTIKSLGYKGVRLLTDKLE